MVLRHYCSLYRIKAIDLTLVALHLA